MIISASRRTDIPAFYSDWFINRLKEGYVLVRNPRNIARISRVTLNSKIVDCIVFWTKNAKPMSTKLDILDAMGYKYYFQFTITPYGNQVEKGLPPKQEIMDTFKRLSDKIGPNRVVWRYDPIIVNEIFSVEYHLSEFKKMANVLGDYTDKCIISFIDLYSKMIKNSKGIADHEVSELHMNKIAEGFSAISKDHRFTLSTCSEKIDFSLYGITHASCIDRGMIQKIIGCPINAKKDASQRPACGCIESIDIGGYNSCSHGCIYCYANASQDIVLRNMKMHSKSSPILIGKPGNEDIITDRDEKSLKGTQFSLFNKDIFR